MTDSIETTHSNPIAVMCILTSAKILLTVVRSHGTASAERAAHLLLTLHSVLSKSVHHIADVDAVSLVVVHKVDSVNVVNVDDTVFPSPIARVLEGWIAEMISQNVAQNVVSGCNKSVCKKFSDSDLLTQHTQNRRLLFFQELVASVEMRVRDYWDKADRLHETFAQSITQILTYRNMAQE